MYVDVLQNVPLGLGEDTSFLRTGGFQDVLQQRYASRIHKFN